MNNYLKIQKKDPKIAFMENQKKEEYIFQKCHIFQDCQKCHKFQDCQKCHKFQDCQEYQKYPKCQECRNQLGEMIKNFQKEVRKRIESDLKFKTIFKTIPDIFFLISKESTILDYKGANYFKNIPKGILLGEKLSEIIPSYLNKGKLFEIISRTISLKKNTTIEYNINRKHEMKYIEASFLYFSKERIAIFIRDISQTKKSVLMVKESEKLLSNIFSSIQDGISIIDKNQKIIRVNPILQQWFSDKKPITGKKLDDIYPKNFKFPENYSFEKILKSKKPFLRKISGLRINGKIPEALEVHSYPLIDEKTGDVTGLIEYFHDITKIKQAEKIISKELVELKKIEFIKDQLIERTSHELKSPMTSIICASQLIIDYYKDKLDAQGKKLIQVINKGGIRMKNIIQDMINAYNLEENHEQSQLKMEKIDIVALIKDAIFELYSLAFKGRLSIDLDTNGEDELFIQANKIKIENLFFNLLSNAIKNTLLFGKISINLQNYERYIEVYIKDTGIGFTPDEKTQIFTKFGKIERPEKEYDIKGLGLGLYVSKQIVEIHGGEIRMESEGRNKGSTFIVKLPKYNL